MPLLPVMAIEMAQHKGMKGENGHPPLLADDCINTCVGGRGGADGWADG